ncbi:MAG TPA: GreA/GreB family elongation factor [Candidatus Saccharimonadales bacterium]|nr:GreA/GreB family elongation factor [Candidatus Saccharimonadales bacterium]
MTHTTLSAESYAALTERLVSLQAQRKALHYKLIEAHKTHAGDKFELVHETAQLDLLVQRIAELEVLLARALVIEAAQADGLIRVGSKVQLETPTGVMQCQVVTAVEADPIAGKISDASPLGRALLGKAREALVFVKGPKRAFSCRVLQVAL